MPVTKKDAQLALTEILARYDAGDTVSVDAVFAHLRVLLAPPAPPKYKPLQDYRCGDPVEVLIDGCWESGKVSQQSPRDDVVRVLVEGWGEWRWRNKRTIRLTS